jgi:hypothetical protein
VRRFVRFGQERLSTELVVADTSPINYLILIGRINLLRQLDKRVLVPPAVVVELKHPLAPKPVQGWAANAPAG